eukprot:355658-Chlamydomonas_euryale.AAC.1
MPRQRRGNRTGMQPKSGKRGRPRKQPEQAPQPKRRGRPPLRGGTQARLGGRDAKASKACSDFESEQRPRPACLMFQIPARQMNEHLHGYMPVELGTVGTVGVAGSSCSQIVNMSVQMHLCFPN